MGNKVVIDTSYGDININLQKQTYTAGEQVNGWVNVSLVKPFLTDTLYLIVSGKESVHFVTKEIHNHDAGHSTYYRKHKDKNEFYEYLLPLYQHPSGFFPVGQYSFPFSFVLAHDLPGSFEYDWDFDGHNCYGRIIYRVKAGFKDKNAKKSFFNKCKFFVNQLWEGPQMQRITQYQKKLSGCCYVDLGTYKIVAHFDQDKFFAGDNCLIRFEVDNSEAKRNAKFFKCQLVQIIVIRAGKEKFGPIFTVLSEETLPGIVMGEARTGSDAFRVNLPITTQDNLQASCSGRLVESQFYLKISTELNACLCCRNHPHTEMDIKIYNKNIEVAPSYPAENWNPQMIPLYICPIGPDVRLTPDMKAHIYS